MNQTSLIESCCRNTEYCPASAGAGLALTGSPVMLWALKSLQHLFRSSCVRIVLPLVKFTSIITLSCVLQILQHRTISQFTPSTTETNASSQVPRSSELNQALACPIFALLLQTTCLNCVISNLSCHCRSYIFWLFLAYDLHELLRKPLSVFFFYWHSFQFLNLWWFFLIKTHNFS